MMTGIETERFILRRFAAGDWRDFQELAIDWKAAPGPAFDKWRTSEEACRESVEHMAGRDNYFAVCVRASGKVIGLLGINGMTEQKELEFGHVILSEYQDDDRDREVLRAFVQYCFAGRGAMAIVTHNAAEHVGQMAPLKSLGLRNHNAQAPGELRISKLVWERGG